MKIIAWREGTALHQELDGKAVPYEWANRKFGQIMNVNVDHTDWLRIWGINTYKRHRLEWDMYFLSKRREQWKYVDSRVHMRNLAVFAYDNRWYWGRAEDIFPVERLKAEQENFNFEKEARKLFQEKFIGMFSMKRVFEYDCWHIQFHPDYRQGLTE